MLHEALGAGAFDAARRIIESSAVQEAPRIADHLFACWRRSCSEEPAIATWCADALSTLGERSGLVDIQARASYAKGYLEGIVEGDVKAGLHETDRAVFLIPGSEHDGLRAEIDCTRVWLLVSDGRFEEAERAALETQTVFESLGDVAGLVTLCSNYAGALQHSGRYPSAVVWIEAAERAAERADSSLEQRLRIQLTRALCEERLGRYERCIALNRSAIRSAVQADLPALAATGMTNLGRILTLVGAHAMALDHHNRALSTFEALDAHRSVLLTRLARIECLLGVEDLEEALAEAEAVAAPLEERGLRIEAGQAHMDRGSALIGLHRLAEAEDALSKAIALLEDAGNTPWAEMARLEFAHARMRAGDAEAGGSLARTVQRRLERAQAWNEAAAAAILAARCALSLGRLDEAEATLAPALARATKEQLDELEYQGYVTLGALEEQRGNGSEALDAYGLAAEALERSLAGKIAEHFASYLVGKEEAYESATRILLRRGETESAWRWSERARARSLLRSLSRGTYEEAEPLDHRVGSPDERSNDGQLRLREERDRLRALLDDARTAGDSLRAAELAQSLRHCDRSLRALRVGRDVSLHARHAAGGVPSSGRETSLALPRLPPGTALIEFFPIEGRWTVFVLRDTTVRATDLDARVEDTNALARRLRLATAPRHAASGSAATRRHNDLLRSALEGLHTLLIQPIADQLVGVSRLLVVPYGELHYVPFAALHDGTAWLIEGMQVSHLPSAAALDELPDWPGVQRGALAVGHSADGRVPEAVHEARETSERLRAALLLERSATRERVTRAVHGPSIVHMAMHAEFYVEEPLFAGLHVESGMLCALDVQDWSLDGALVVLSACDTGQAVVAGGDEVLGLVRSFFLGGASALIASLWPVDDRLTRSWASSFYEGLMSNDTIAEAHSHSLRHMISAGKGDERLGAAAWAAFVLHAGLC